MAKCPISGIAKKAGEKGVPFLVIGGYAVLAHGYVRATADLDLITSHEQRDKWKELLSGFGMTVQNDAETFLQFDPADQAGMNVDLMFVSGEVYAKLEQRSIEAQVENTPVKVVSLIHLIALKCHAIQHSKSLRRLKDMDDLIQLIAINQLNLNEPELRATIIRYAGSEVYEKLQLACAGE